MVKYACYFSCVFKYVPFLLPGLYSRRDGAPTVGSTCGRSGSIRAGARQRHKQCTSAQWAHRISPQESASRFVGISSFATTGLFYPCFNGMSIIFISFFTEMEFDINGINWAAPSEFGTYRLCEQRRFRRACASAQSRQNLRCSLIQAVSQEEPSDRKPDPWLL